MSWGKFPKQTLSPGFKGKGVWGGLSGETCEGDRNPETGVASKLWLQESLVQPDGKAQSVRHPSGVLPRSKGAGLSPPHALSLASAPPPAGGRVTGGGGSHPPKAAPEKQAAVHPSHLRARSLPVQRDGAGAVSIICGHPRGAHGLWLPLALVSHGDPGPPVIPTGVAGGGGWNTVGGPGQHWD